MKQYLFTALLAWLTPLSAFSQTDLAIDTIAFNFSEVVPVDSMTAKELYSNAKLYIANVFVSSKDVTQLQDENTNTIVVKGLFKYSLKDLPYAFSYIKNFMSTFKLQIQTKDNRFKYTLTDFIVQDNPVYNKYDLSSPYEKQKGEIGEKQHRKLWNAMKESAYEYVKAFANDLKKKISTNSNF